MELPPVLQLLTTELPESKLRPEAILRLIRDKGFFEEIHSQAEYSAKKELSSGPKHAQQDEALTIYPTGALNPLTVQGKCAAFKCRIEQAESFARSIGLYCDYSVLTDYITGYFRVPLPKDVDGYKELADDLYSDLKVLNVLMPLVREGIVKFGNTGRIICKDCSQKLTGPIVKELWELFLKDAAIEVRQQDDGTKLVWLRSSLNSPFVSLMQFPPQEGREIPTIKRPVKISKLPSKAFNIIKELRIQRIFAETINTFYEAKDASEHLAALVTDSRQDAVALRRLDKGLVSVKEFENWEKLRAIRLPWVSGLTVGEIIRLREIASGALPAFRSRMQRELFSSFEKSGDPDKQALRVAKSLREEVNEVAAELHIAAKKAGHGIHASLGLSAIGCIVYGIGAHDATAIEAAKAFTLALAAMHHPSKTAHAEVEKLKTKPAYVLLAARDIIQHRQK